MKNLSSVLYFIAGFLFLLAAWSGSGPAFYAIGACFFRPGHRVLAQKQPIKTRPESRVPCTQRGAFAPRCEPVLPALFCCVQIRPSSRNAVAMPSSLTAGQTRVQRALRAGAPLAMQ